MKVLFISNYLTHHQLPFCEEMYRRLGGDFLFVATNAMEEERLRMGWALDTDGYPFARFYDDDKEGFERLVMESEVVICGGTHFWYVERRVAAGKTTFRYFERLYKNGRLKAFYPGSYYRKLKEHTKYRKAPVYLLCAGAYVPADFRLFGAYSGKMYKWGYFPQARSYEMDGLMAGKRKGSILWTGRMLDWKHPEEAVLLAEALRKEGLSFHLTMIGEGEMRAGIEKMVEDKQLQELVTIKKFMKPEKVRAEMEKSRLYLLTSGQQEGWGAVVNEAMNSGCAVIATAEAGSVPYLIRDGGNGYIYPQGNLKKLAAVTKRLLENEKDCVLAGKNAYRTITGSWNASVAAERFLELCRALQAGRDTPFDADVLSRAEVVTVSKNSRRYR